MISRIRARFGNGAAPTTNPVLWSNRRLAASRHRGNHNHDGRAPGSSEGRRNTPSNPAPPSPQSRSVSLTTEGVLNLKSKPLV